MELKHSDFELGSRIYVIGWERVVGEAVLIAGVQEKFRVLDLLHDPAGCVDVASPTKIGSLSIPWIWIATPSGQGQKPHSPVIGRQE